MLLMKHECPDWDYLLIGPGDPIMSAARAHPIGGHMKLTDPAREAATELRAIAKNHTGILRTFHIGDDILEAADQLERLSWALDEVISVHKRKGECDVTMRKVKKQLEKWNGI
jgi:hypothetical protein